MSVIPVYLRIIKISASLHINSLVNEDVPQENSVTPQSKASHNCILFGASYVPDQGKATLYSLETQNVLSHILLEDYSPFMNRKHSTLPRPTGLMET